MALPGILKKIVETKKQEVAALEDQRQDIIDAAIAQKRQTISFKDALSQSPMAVISEVKKASPSAGIISKDFDHIRMATTYENGGAAAISVLTDIDYFQGSPEYLKEIRHEVKIPLIRKDFIIDPIQIYEAALWGADAFLLIVAILDLEQIKEYIALGKKLGLDALVEIHDREELQVALAADAEIIGINNRDLRDFTTDLGLSARLSVEIPQEKIIVGESGIKTAEDVKILKESGCHAILVGETLMRHGFDGAGNAIQEMINA